MTEATVVLGLEDGALQDEVLSFLDRLPGVRVVGAASDASRLEEAVRRSDPDVAVVTPDIISGATDLNGATLLVLGERETTEALRAAVSSGARGFYLWPEERSSLARDVESTGRTSLEAPDPGRVLAVYGPRGGAGTTFLATNLTAAIARKAATVLVDLDVCYGEVGVALGVPSSKEVQTLADLGPVLDELTSEHVDRVLYEHPRGFRVLLGTPAPTDPLAATQVSGLIDVLRHAFAAVVLHLPRHLDMGTREAMRLSDEVVMVVTLDVLAFRDARRVLTNVDDLDRRCRLVVNRATRAEVIPEDAERVFGLAPVAIIPTDRSVARAQNRGELVVGRSGRAARQIEKLARTLMETEA